MDDSEDKNKRKTQILSDWMNSPLERVNHSTNFEDACTSDDTKLLFTSDSIVSNDKRIDISTPKQMHETNKGNYLSYSQKLIQIHLKLYL